MKNIIISKPVYGILLFSFFLNACSSGASHLPSPFELPGMIIGTAIDNASYSAKRKKVERYVARNYLGIRQDVIAGGGRILDGAFNSANIAANKRAKVKRDFLSNQQYIFHNTLMVEDALINVFSALFVNSSSAKDKRINGLGYIQARNIIREFAERNFEALRIDIKQGSGQTLDQLATALSIHDAQKRDKFVTQSQRLYQRIYLEPVVLSLMVE